MSPGGLCSVAWLALEDGVGEPDPSVADPVAVEAGVVDPPVATVDPAEPLPLQPSRARARTAPRPIAVTPVCLLIIVLSVIAALALLTA
jgi:hypothetical protein